VADVFLWLDFFHVVVAQTDNGLGNHEWQLIEAIFVTSMEVDHSAFQAVSYGFLVDRVAAKCAYSQILGLEEMKYFVVLGEDVLDVTSNN